MKNKKSIFLFVVLFSMVLLPIACTSTISVPSSPSLAATATVTTTFTPTATVTLTIPMGLLVQGGFEGLFADTSLYGGSISPVTISTVFDISINHSAETTDAITLTTPIEGAIPVTYSQLVTQGGVPFAQYSSANQYTYVPNGNYSLSVSTSLGTVTSAMSAPGSITFSASGDSVTATYPGIYDYALVQETSPTTVVTYYSPIGTSVGSPFSFPVTAYSSPATFGNTYGAAQTVYYSGPAATGSYFIGIHQLTKFVAK